MKKTRWRWPLVAGWGFTAVIFAGLVVMCQPMYPIGSGSSADFWFVATSVDLGGGHEWPEGAGMVEDGYAYYLVETRYSAGTYRVPLGAVMRDYPRVVEALGKKMPDAHAASVAALAYQSWKWVAPDRQGGVNGLLRYIEDENARVSWIVRGPAFEPGTVLPPQMLHDELRSLVARSHYYWANFVFEFLFLSGLVWFVLWPAVRRAGLWRWLAHLAAAPFLFLLPSWLGYCSLCGQHVGRPGGILYPAGTWCANALELRALSSNAEWEETFFRSIPKLLEQINQTSWDLNLVIDPEINRPFHVAGPLCAVIVSVVFCLVFLGSKGMVAAWRRCREKQAPRGFEVVMKGE